MRVISGGRGGLTPERSACRLTVDKIIDKWWVLYRVRWDSHRLVLMGPMERRYLPWRNLACHRPCWTDLRGTMLHMWERYAR
jgi:hypothetical protein